MRHSVALFLGLIFSFSFSLFSSPSSLEVLTDCVHRSLSGDADCWRQGIVPLAQEKAALRDRYNEALQLLGGWHAVVGIDEVAILDAVAKHQGLVPSKPVRWQISALLLIALRGQSIAAAGKASTVSSKLSAVWRLLKGSWYVLVLAALVVYFGWGLLKKFFPTLAKLLKDMAQRFRGGARSAGTDDPCNGHVSGDKEEATEEDDSVLFPVVLPWKAQSTTPGEPWLDAVPLYNPPPPDDGPGGNAVSAEGTTLRRVWRATCHAGETFGQWLDRNGGRVQVCTGVLRDVGMGVGGFMVGVAQGAGKAVCQPAASAHPAGSEREQFLACVVPGDTAVSRGMLRVAEPPVPSIPSSPADVSLSDMAARVNALDRNTTVLTAASALSAACAVGGMVQRRMAEKPKASCCRCSHTERSAGGGHQR